MISLKDSLELDRELSHSTYIIRKFLSRISPIKNIKLLVDELNRCRPRYRQPFLFSEGSGEDFLKEGNDNVIVVLP